MPDGLAGLLAIWLEWMALPYAPCSGVMTGMLAQLAITGEPAHVWVKPSLLDDLLKHDAAVLYLHPDDVLGDEAACQDFWPEGFRSAAGWLGSGDG